ncbi:MFS transporter [Streptomyces sp. NPDC003703]|uniref:MFS transporter n=1 Tax=Streptomyces sp. NPDC003283 TaxID=3364681 RepID=UPI0036B2DCB4
MRALLVRRDILLLMLARLIDMAGSNALWIALGVRVKELTGSDSAAGLTFFAFVLGTLGAPLCGALVDRSRRAPLLIALNLFSMALVLPLLLVHDRHGIWICYAVMVLYGLASGTSGSAMTALTQALIPPERLGDANGLLQTLLQGVRLIAPLLGAGVLSASGLAPLVVGDAVTFALVALLVALIRLRENGPRPSGPEAEGQGAGARLAAGFRHIVGTAALRRFTVATMIAVVAFGFSQSVLFAVVDSGLGRPPAFVGVLGATQAAGAVVAGAGAAMLMRRAGETRTVVFGLVLSAAGFLLTAVPALPAVVPGTVLMGTGLPWIIAGGTTLLQRRTPAHLMGRTDAALGVLIGLPQTVAIAVGAALVALVDYRVMLVLMAVLTSAAALYLATRTARRATGGPHPDPVTTSP